MQIIKTLSISFLLGVAMLNSTAFGKNNAVSTSFSEIPVKTVCIKNPAAVDANKFFAEATIVSFEVYKAGSKDEVAKIITALKKDAAVESVTALVASGFGMMVDCQATTCHFRFRLINVPVFRLLPVVVVPSGRIVMLTSRNATTAALPYCCI